MSDGAEKRRVTSVRSRQRRKGVPRGGKHGLSRPTVAAPATEVAAVSHATPVAPLLPSRRASALSLPQGPVLNRDAEIAYIRADMRRLLIIAGALLALMVVILVIVDR